MAFAQLLEPGSVNEIERGGLERVLTTFERRAPPSLRVRRNRGCAQAARLARATEATHDERQDAFQQNVESRQRSRLGLDRERKGSGLFREANHQAITRCLTDSESGFRMVVNIPADALLSFMQGGRYLNASDLPVVAGKRREPSEARRRVDALVGFKDPRALLLRRGVNRWHGYPFLRGVLHGDAPRGRPTRHQGVRPQLLRFACCTDSRALPHQASRR